VRRAFTVLEISLAVLIGAVVVVAALSMFMAVERTDRVLTVRAEQGTDLARARLVMQRSFMSLLMSGTRPIRRAGTNRDADAPFQPERELTPRLILDADPRLEGLHMTRRDHEGFYGIQRLEVVLTDSPVPDRTRDVWVWALEAAPVSSHDAATTSDVEAEEAQSPFRAVRGAFEFWPQGTRGEQGRFEDLLRSLGDNPETPLLWELWWIPLPPRGEFIDDPPPAVPVLAEPYLIASNIRYARWTMYDDREKKVRHVAALRQNIPAYIEFEVETGAGLSAEFMFEVDAAQGPEAPLRSQTEPPTVPASPTSRGSGGTGSSGGNPLDSGGAGGGTTGGGKGGGKDAGGRTPR
jgi:uncharacterized membrane protein YgcG